MGWELVSGYEDAFLLHHRVVKQTIFELLLCATMHCRCCQPIQQTVRMQLVKYVVRGGRPLLPDRQELPGYNSASFTELDSYISLMETCWAQDPEARPSFVQISDMLRYALHTQASHTAVSPSACSVLWCSQIARSYTARLPQRPPAPMRGIYCTHDA